MPTLSPAVTESGSSTPGTLATAGPRGAAVPLHGWDQEPEKEAVEGSRDAVGEEKFR